MSLGNKTILIVDDEPRTRQGIKQTLEVWAAGRYIVETCDNGVEARERLRQERVHLLITDVRMPEVSGLDLIHSLQEAPRKPVIIVISGYAEFDYVQQAMRLGAVNYLLKPLDKSELLTVVEDALKREEEQQRHVKLEKLVDHKLLEIDPEQAGMGQPVKEAIAYVEQHLHEQLTMAEVAGMIHLNASYFSVLFKEQAGVSFTEYLSRLRIQRAKELLLQTALPVGEIGERVGYRTDKYFIKVFKSLEAISPSRYRQQMKGGAQEIQ
ncbi:MULTISPECIES: response regulator [Paenibacillus]|uniref:YesN/AraC family two-component response regulator n=1 Tax=Paenibacillus silagei TaxID=1670801 RepID=A0ABS4NJH1_9BACL|nr:MULTISPECIES: response regulator [Paenibacillus]ETT64335.1 chemotaxis protein CheY [Paenibacillus sp. FSL R7-277]MBP2110192.1 YesN/AraC family two-component response regulator [Paenibacillus silagei]OMG02667.1 DNA-binding response regulator [Paenibacillus sp. FSL R7-0333]